MNPEVPSQYKPYGKLSICSNQLVGVKVPFLVGGKILLLIGQGENFPMVWLAAPTNPSRSVWKYVIEGGWVNHHAVQMSVDSNNRSVKVTLASNTVLKAKAISDDEAVVTYLDLRPIGLAIEGDENGLRVGGMSLSGNRFANMFAAFSFGNEPEK